MESGRVLIGMLVLLGNAVTLVDGNSGRNTMQRVPITVDSSSGINHLRESALMNDGTGVMSLKEQIMVQHNVSKISELMKKMEDFYPTNEEREAEEEERYRRNKARRERVQERLKKEGLKPPPLTEMQQEMDIHELHSFRNANKENKDADARDLKQNQQERRTANWWQNIANSEVYNALEMANLADPSAEWDKWAQGYRMLGAFIDCDHDQGGDRRRRKRRTRALNLKNFTIEEQQRLQEERELGSGDGGGGGCSRWMMWASYVNPNYQGYEYNEYHGDEPYSALDCHRSDTEWLLMGVYRQEFYQFIEQISKHLWAIDDYEYIVARAGLMYITDYDCFVVGADSSGNSIYAGVEPQSNGRFMMALYSDEYCLYAQENLGTYDDYVGQSDVDLGSKDEGDGDSTYLYEWWYDTQEYTLTNLNDVYESFLYCTHCMDHPTYQDGYFIGDYGTDDDDMINQCWKFHSHDSFICEAECIALGHAQGSITQIMYGDKVFGNKYGMSDNGSSSSSVVSGKKADALVESSWSRIMANAFLTFSFLLFIATFLAFAVARRSRYRESRSSRSRKLLDDDHMGGRMKGSTPRNSSNRSRRSSRSKRSKSGSRRAKSTSRRREEDGLFRTSGNRSRAGSRARSKSSRKRSSSKHRDRSRSKNRGELSSGVDKGDNAIMGMQPGMGGEYSGEANRSGFRDEIGKAAVDDF